MSAAAASAPPDLPRFSLRRHSAALTVSLLGLMKERDNELAAGAHHAHATQDERRGKGLSGFLRRFSRKKDKKTAIARVPSEEEDSTPRRMSTQSRAWITPTPVIPTSHQRSPAIPRRRVASQPTNKIWSVNDASWEDAILGYRPRGKLPQSAPRKNQDKELDIDLSVGHVDDHNITSSFACTGVRDFERLRANLEAQEGGWMCSRQSTAFSTTSSTSEESIKPWSTVAGLNSPQARPSFDVWYPEPALIRYGDCERAMQAGETLRRGDGFVAEKLHAGLEAMKREELKIDVDNNGYGGAAIYRYGQFKHEAEAAATTESQSLAFSTPVANQRFSAFSLTSSTRRVSNPLDGVVAPPRQTLPSLTPNLFGYGVNPVEAQDDGREVCDEKAVIRSTDSLVTLPCADPIAMWPKYWDSVSGSSDTPISTPGRSSVGRFASDFPGHEIVGDPDATITCKHATGSSRNISRGMPEANHPDASLYASRDYVSKDPSKPLVRVSSEPRSLFLNRQLSAHGTTSPSNRSPTRARSVDSGILNLGEMTSHARGQSKVRDCGDFRQYAAAARDGGAGETVVVGDLKKKTISCHRSFMNLNGQQVAIGRPRVLSGLLRCQPRLPVPRKNASEVKVIALEPTVRLRMVGSR